jgi:CspA family cold shock protein
MNFRDQVIQCELCGKRFILTVTEQRRLHASGQEVSPPTRCPDCRLRDPVTGRWTGQVKWFNHEKGYGFIVRADNEEIFFHRSQIAHDALAALQEGTRVVFDQMSTSRGQEAQDVQIVSDE